MDSSSQEMAILTVSQLTQAIKLCLEGTFPAITLQGEVSNCKLQTSGHLYFCLKDAQAQISAVMFRGNLNSLKIVPKDGAQVIVKGELNVFPPSGKYQLIVRELRLAGLGELLLRLEELKAKLLKRGWFRQEHKKPLPPFPQRIGVITSPTGAVIKDILHILERRAKGFHLILNPVRVQGEGAAQEIAKAIETFNRHDLVDVLIVGRGGGSMEDLWPFNEEVVAEAIFNSRIPIISAVGHETDHCIADYVADVRAPTPSAAAEIVTQERSQLLGYLEQSRKHLRQTVLNLIRIDRQRLESIKKNPFLSSPYTLLGSWMQRLDLFRSECDAAIMQKVTHLHHLIDSRKRQLQALKPHTLILHFRQKLVYWDKALLGSLQARMAEIKKLIVQKRVRMEQAHKARLMHLKHQFNSVQKEQLLHQSFVRLLHAKKERLHSIIHALHAVDPKNLLTKGYCIPFAEKTDSVITSVHHLSMGEEMRLLFHDGKALAVVKEIHSTQKISSQITANQENFL